MINLKMFPLFNKILFAAATPAFIFGTDQGGGATPFREAWLKGGDLSKPQGCTPKFGDYGSSGAI